MANTVVSVGPNTRIGLCIEREIGCQRPFRPCLLPPPKTQVFFRDLLLFGPRRHVLRKEDGQWKMISQYADGNYRLGESGPPRPGSSP
jgi:hypothetical protein